MLNKNQLTDLEKETEPKFPVQESWFELVPGVGFEWSPPRADQCEGAHCSGAFGPSSAMKKAARNAKNLSALFF